MKTFFASIACAALALGAAGPLAAKDRATRGEERLAKMIEGRTAGTPVSCINTNRSTALEVIDRTALVYDGGKTVYVARPKDPRQLDDFDVLVINRFSPTQLCVHDQMRTIDPHSGFTTGVVFLDGFVPYTKED
jgi:hypothetical protein